MRLFVAIDVGEAVRAEVARVCGVMRELLEALPRPPKVVWVKPEALHVTIKFLGEVEQDAAADVQSRLPPTLSLPAFDVEWRGIGAFPSPRHPRALWMGVVRGGPELGAVETEVARRLGGVIEPEVHSFFPHLTLGRIKMPGSGPDWPKLLKDLEVRGVVSRVDRVTLYRSVLGRGGPHYTEICSSQLTVDSSQ